MNSDKCQVCYVGPLRVTAPDGTDLTPKGSKARGLVALLADYPRARRSRRWLEAHLWSDRSPRQASGSLRQALTDVRTALGEWRDILHSNRLEVWLDDRFVETDIDPGGVRAHPSRELLEGLDTRDQEFEDWLRAFRQRETGSWAPDPPADPPADQAGAERPPLRLHSKVIAEASGAERLVAGILADQVGLNLAEGLGAVRGASPSAASEIEVCTEATEDGGQVVLVARVVHLRSDRMLFSGFRTMPSEQDGRLCEQQIAEFAHDAAARAIARLPYVSDLDRCEVVAAGFAEIGKRRLFSYDLSELDAADDLLDRAFDAHPNGTFLGWRAFQRATQVIEGLAPCTPELIEEADALVRRAEEVSPENGQVHAIAALIRLLLFDDIDGGIRSAEAGLRRNPNSMFVRQCMALAAGALGHDERAYELSHFCRPALGSEDARHLWDLYHGLVCISTGRFDEARKALETAVRVCPDFRAPHRQLIALNARLGAHEAAATHFERLLELEPDLTLDRYVRDTDYPVTTLRRAGLLDPAHFDLRL